jgi:hypothetical protein
VLLAAPRANRRERSDLDCVHLSRTDLLGIRQELHEGSDLLKQCASGTKMRHGGQSRALSQKGKNLVFSRADNVHPAR